MYRIAKEFTFEAAHSLPHLGPRHKCYRDHGHSYVVEVVLAADELDHRHFAGVDYADLNEFGEWLDGRFDHRNLNDVVDFPTTAENLARHFFRWCKKRWPQMECVRVSETRKVWVEYRE